MARCPSCQEDFEGPEHECRSGPSSDQIDDAVALIALDAELDEAVAASRKRVLQSLVNNPAMQILAKDLHQSEVFQAVLQGKRRLCESCRESVRRGGDLCDSCLNGTDEDGHA